MRKHTLVNSLKCALLAAPILAACGGGASTGSVVIPAGGLVFPDCADGELISVGADKTLGCVPAPAGKLSPPSCLVDQVLTAEGGQLKCVAKGKGGTDATIAARIDAVNSQLMQINNTVNNLKAGSGGRAKFLGVTNASTAGRISAGGQIGIGGASQFCKTEYATATNPHMCSVYEMYEAVATAQITQATNLPANGAWVYAEAWNKPATSNASQDPNAGMNENCASYIYGTGDRGWTGTLVRWQTSTLNATDKTLKFFTGSADAACSLSRQVACCD